jgi:hypothetical protein
MMANAPIGNNIFEGPLGVVVVEFDGLDLGKTTADTELMAEEDVKDIIYQQNGTKPYDKVPTGINYMLKVTLGEITTAKIEKLLRGTSAQGNSLKMGRTLYTSLRDAAKALKVTRVDSDGVASTDPRFTMAFYKAIPIIDGGFQWGADTQRNLAISFYIFFDETELAFGYCGYASSLGLSNA